MNVRDTELLIPESKGGLPFRVCHPKTKPVVKPLPNGKVMVTKVTPEEMEKLWK